MLKVFRLDKHSTEINQVMSLHALWETFSQNWSSIDRLNKTSINLIDCSHGAENLDRFSVAGAEKIQENVSACKSGVRGESWGLYLGVI